MNPFRRFAALTGLWLTAAVLAGQPVPVTLTPVVGRQGMVVAGHPQATEAGLAVLQAGGNAIDAAVATSLVLGAAEPYASGLGGKLMLLYYESASNRTYVVDAMDAAGSIDVPATLKRPEEDRSYGYGAVCVPGLAAGLWAAHEKWGGRPWAEDVRPAVAVARTGFRVLPKSRDLFEEQSKKLHRGDAEIARLYLPGGRLPEVGSLLPNPDLARTLELLAQHGRDGFYRGPVADAIAAAAAKGGGAITRADLARYAARVTEPVGVEFHGYRVESAPPPASGAAMFLPALKALEEDALAGGPLRTAANLDRLGRVWSMVEPDAYRLIGDAPESRFNFERLVAPDAIRALRAKTLPRVTAPPAAVGLDGWFPESAMAATTHFIVVDRHGNIVCATQSLSLHFGAGVVPPGTGVVLNNSMSNFDYKDAKNPDYLAPGRRPRSTISPTIIRRGGRPVLAIGIPGSTRIPTAMLQVLLDHLVLHRPLADAIGDTRFHFTLPRKTGDVETFEAEQSLPAAVADAVHALGWKVELSEPAGRGRRFGGMSAVELNPDGTLTGYADPRRTNSAAGY
jgi:gamma-glutamyltranspeptidase/glutathione hydrolase